MYMSTIESSVSTRPLILNNGTTYAQRRIRLILHRGLFQYHSSHKRCGSADLPFCVSPPFNRNLFNFVSPEVDVEIRPDVKCYVTQLQGKGLSIEHFERFSNFDTLQRAVALLIHVARSYKSPNIMDKYKGWHKCEMPLSPDELYQAREVIIRAVQSKAFEKEFEALERDKPAPLNSCLRCLNPILRE